MVYCAGPGDSVARDRPSAVGAVDVGLVAGAGRPFADPRAGALGLVDARRPRARRTRPRAASRRPRGRRRRCCSTARRTAPRPAAAPAAQNTSASSYAAVALLRVLLGRSISAREQAAAIANSSAPMSTMRAEERLPVLELRLPAAHAVERLAGQLARRPLDEPQVLGQPAELVVRRRDRALADHQLRKPPGVEARWP